MVTKVRTWFCMATQLSAWLCCRVPFVQCEKYYKYEVTVEEPSGALHICYNAIIDAGVKRLQPKEVKGKNAKVDVYSETNLLDRTIHAKLSKICKMKIIDAKYPARDNKIEIGKQFAIFSDQSQRDLLIASKIEVYKEYMIFWGQVDYKLYWCRGGNDDVEKLERDHSFLFAPMKLVDFVMDRDEPVEKMRIHVPRNRVERTLAALLRRIQKFSLQMLYEAPYDISHSEKCHDILRKCSNDEMFALSPSESRGRDLMVLSRKRDSCIMKSPDCQFKFVKENAIPHETSKDSSKQSVQAETSQASSRLDDVVVVTYQPTHQDLCIKCINLQCEDRFFTPLSSIMIGSSPDAEWMFRTRSNCVHEVSICTSVMLRPAGVCELSELIEEFSEFSETFNLKSTEEKALARVYSVEAARLGPIPYKGKRECAKCLFRFF